MPLVPLTIRVSKNEVCAKSPTVEVLSLPRPDKAELMTEKHLRAEIEIDFDKFAFEVPRGLAGS